MTTEPRAPLPPAWAKFQVVCISLASIAVPIVVGVVGNEYAKAQKNTEIAARYVELAIGVLRQDPSGETAALRTWAVSVVDHFSPVRLGDGVQAELEKRRLAVDAVAHGQFVMDQAVEEILRKSLQPQRPPEAQKK